MQTYWFIDRIRPGQPIDNSSGLITPGPLPLHSPLIFDLLSDVNESFPLTPGTEEWVSAKAMATAARASHLATIGWAPNQIALGNNDTLYAICSDPHSRDKYPHYPNCTITPDNWHAPYCSCGGDRWRLCSTCSSTTTAPSPYHPVNSTNCTYVAGVKYNHPIHASANVPSKQECCRLCYLSAECVASAWHEPSDPDQPTKCFLHSSTDGEGHGQRGVVGCVTGRVHAVG